MRSGACRGVSAYVGGVIGTTEALPYTGVVKRIALPTIFGKSLFQSLFDVVSGIYGLVIGITIDIPGYGKDRRDLG